jgi:hypothetical protein
MGESAMIFLVVVVRVMAAVAGWAIYNSSNPKRWTAEVEAGRCKKLGNDGSTISDQATSTRTCGHAGKEKEMDLGSSSKLVGWWAERARVVESWRPIKRPAMLPTHQQPWMDL